MNEIAQKEIIETEVIKTEKELIEDKIRELETKIIKGIIQDGSLNQAYDLTILSGRKISKQEFYFETLKRMIKKDQL